MGTARDSCVLIMRRPASPWPFHSTSRTQAREYHSPDFSPGASGSPADAGQLLLTPVLVGPPPKSSLCLLEAACVHTSRTAGIWRSSRTPVSVWWENWAGKGSEWKIPGVPDLCLLPLPHRSAVPAPETHKMWHCACPLWVAQNSAWLQLLHGGHVVPDGGHLLPALLGAGVGSCRWGGVKLGSDWVPGLFPFRNQCSASLWMGCSRKVSIHRSLPDLPWLPPSVLPASLPSPAFHSIPSSGVPSLPFSSPSFPPLPSLSSLWSPALSLPTDNPGPNCVHVCPVHSRH